jgi:hypothetical protein
MTLHVRYHNCFKSLRLTACYLKTITYFRIVLYGCETWSVTGREEHRLRVCEDRVLRETTGGNSAVGTAVALRNMRWAGHVARRHKRNVPYKKESLKGRPTCKYKRRRYVDILCSSDCSVQEPESMAMITVWCAPRGADPPVAQECRCSHARLHIWDTAYLSAPRKDTLPAPYCNSLQLHCQ